MNNPLFKLLGGQMPMPGRMGNMQNLVQQFQQFRNSFRGDPRQQIQQMLNSGRVSQEQYNNAMRMAQQMQNLLK